MIEQTTPVAATPLQLTPAAPVAPPRSVTFPLGWLLEHAAAPIQYRAIKEVGKLPVDSDGLDALPYGFAPAIELAMLQSPDGTWSSSMLTVPSTRAQHFEGVGTIKAFRRLCEYGWDKESPPLVHARRILFRLLAADLDPAYLFEFGGKGKKSPEMVRRGRGILREAAAAALAQAGYEGDPRLRGAASRILERISDFLRSDIADKPFIRVGNKHVLAAEAYPPSIYALTMLAHMPLFLNEHPVELDLIYDFITQSLPRQASVQLVGEEIVPQPHLVLGDMLPHRNAVDADVPWALVWLELMARLGFLARNENWSKLFDRFLDDRNAEGVWHPHKGMAVARSLSPFVWPVYPLEADLSGEERWTDVTFRLGLIARAAGRPIELE